MSGFADREKNRERKGVAASMIDIPQKQKEKRGRPKEERETKKRISLAVLPSIYEDMQKISYIERKSMSEIVSDFFEQYVKDNADKIKEYDRIKQD